VYRADLPVVTTDVVKLKSILENLVNNAIKFTDAGNVLISARHLPENGTIKFKVTDTGIGIPREEIPLIFEKFHQADGSQTRAFGGVGLGLHIVKKYSELLGAQIEVESEQNVGSTFTLTLPLLSREEARNCPAPPTSYPAPL
jgi:signal transduction histidine kinase